MAGDPYAVPPVPGAPHEQSAGVPGATNVPAGAPSTGADGDGGDTLVSITDLKVHFPITSGVIVQRKVGAVRAVDGLSFDVLRGETLGLVGESGCGKSTTGRAILQLERLTAGHVFYEGADLARLHGGALRRQRRRMQLIFQDPYASLNSRMTLGHIVGEPLLVHDLRPRGEREDRVKELLNLVGLNPNTINRYPHEFSGGQRQRIGIARALAVEPKLHRLRRAGQRARRLDPGADHQPAARPAAQLRADLPVHRPRPLGRAPHLRPGGRHVPGRIVELAANHELYGEPFHPYTQALLSAVPIPDPLVEERRRPVVLAGDVPSPASPPSGCHFHTRCPAAQEGLCDVDDPVLREIKPGHYAACHLVTDTDYPKIRSAEDRAAAAGTAAAGQTTPGGDAS